MTLLMLLAILLVFCLFYKITVSCITERVTEPLIEMRQELDGPQAKQLNLVPCGQKLHNSRNSKTQDDGGGWTLLR